MQRRISGKILNLRTNSIINKKNLQNVENIYNLGSSSGLATFG